MLFTCHHSYAPPAQVSNQAADRNRRQIDELQAETDRLYMIVEALWTFIKVKNGYEDQQLVDLINKIDLKDGTLDGKVAASPPKPCPGCQRPVVPSRHQVCLYCGVPVPKPAFKG